MKGVLRDRPLGLVALVLALLALATGLRPHGEVAHEPVVLVTQPVAAGAQIAPSALRVVELDTSMVAPSMVHSLAEASGSVALVRLWPGDYVTRNGIARERRAVVRSGERAVPLRVDPSAAPPRDMLRPGARVDVAIAADADRDRPARSVVVAGNLEILWPARRIDGTLVVTVRATTRVAVELTAAQSYARDLRLLLRSPGDREPTRGIEVLASEIGDGS